MKHLFKKRQEKRARREIERLFELAKEAETQERADRYVDLARRTAMRHQLRVPKGLKRLFCKKCGSFFRGDNVRTRIHDGKLIQTCQRCNHIQRLPLK